MAFTRFCRAALTGQTISVYGDGQQVRDFTYVHDVVIATRAAATGAKCAGGVYNVGGGGQVSLADSLRLLAELTGRALDVTYGPVVSGDVRRTSASIDSARRDLEYAPQTDFQTGLGHQFEWMKALLSSEGGPTAA
jgi:nucleoside-diphosphate-sugar epimerase